MCIPLKLKQIELIILILLFSLITTPSNAQDQQITICRPNNMLSSLLYVAEDQKYFEEEGLKVKFETASNAKQCLDLMASGRADFANSGDAPIVYTSISNPQYKIIAKTNTDSQIGVFARKDFGIHKIEDLKGKKLACLPGTVSYLLLARLLEKYGWKKEDFKLISMQPQAMTLALSSGIVDAILIWEPWGSQAILKLGNDGIDFSMENLYVSSHQIVANDKVINSSPEIVKKVLKVYLKAEEYILKNREASIALISNKTSYPIEILKQKWDSYKIRIEFNSSMKTLFKENFRLLKKYDENFAEVAEPDFDKLFDRSFLKEVAGERVIE